MRVFVLSQNVLILIGMLGGMAVNFNHPSFTVFVLSGVSGGLFMGGFGFVTQFYESYLKNGLLALIYLSFVLVLAMVFALPSCTADARYNADIAKHPVSGEIEEELFTGSSSCGTLEFPWYYLEPTEAEEEQYCDANPDTPYCSDSNPFVPETSGHY